MNDIIWMKCPTCQKIVRANETNICLSCQKGFTEEAQADDYFKWKLEQIEKAKQGLLEKECQKKHD